MNISFNWLQEYLNKKLELEEITTVLTDIGLEVGKVETYESVKGGLCGLVIGHVRSCKKHENSDHLSVTETEVGNGELLPIVCGAPNVAEGQKVVVATVGATLYSPEGEGFQIKKSKIRGELSMGMICAEDEIGLGNSHEGIMVLPEDAPVGTPANEYFKLEQDYTIEIDLTPNRIDAASHIGVARDLAAYYAQQEAGTVYQIPSVEAFKTEHNSPQVSIKIANERACNRYAGLCIEGVKVSESPDWLQQKLKAIGLNPVNNVVDVTNYVLHETGQPLHAFDLDKIQGNQVQVKTLPTGTKFTTLDGVERELHADDLMICNDSEPMCFAGVLGGLDSGTTERTTNIFLESAYFNPVYVRKTAKRHGISTDSSFRFERGIDPNGQVYALQRAALLIQQVAGGSFPSPVADVHPAPIANTKLNLDLTYVNALLGEEIPKDKVISILKALEFKILAEQDAQLEIEVPAYRVDVLRQADVVEEILRIYGFNTIKIPQKLNSAIVLEHGVNKHKLQNIVSNQLSANGYYEVMNNSLSKEAYYQNLAIYPLDKAVKLLNPLSSDLNVLRQTLLFGLLENVRHNINHSKSSLKLYELGKSYFMQEAKNEQPVSKYGESEHFGLLVTGSTYDYNWKDANKDADFFTLKEQVEAVLHKLNINASSLKTQVFENELLTGIEYAAGEKVLVQLGEVKLDILKQFDIAQKVCYANINWPACLKLYSDQTQFKELPKFPEVNRDLSLLIDQQVSFADLKAAAEKIERKLLKSVKVVDVYTGKGVDDSKKSYTLNFVFGSENKTLTAKQVDKCMDKFIKAYQTEFSAILR